MDYNEYVEVLAEEILAGEGFEKTAGGYVSTAKAVGQISKGIKATGKGVKNYVSGKGLAMQMNAGRTIGDVKRGIGSAKSGISNAARNAIADAKTPEGKAAIIRRLKQAGMYGAIGGAGAGAGMAAMHYGRQNKAAAYFNEAQFLKQAAEESYLEAQAMEDAAILAYNVMNE